MSSGVCASKPSTGVEPRGAFPQLGLIVSGTGLSLDLVRESITSTVGKPVFHPEVFSDTGSFDNEEKQGQYIAQRVWPGCSSLNDTQKQILKRAWRWLRGRHRFTALYATLLKQMGDKSAHRLLDILIRAITNGFDATDGAMYSSKEPIIHTIPMVFDRIDLKKLSQVRYRGVENELFLSVMGWVLRSKPYIIREKCAEAVSLGVARVTPGTANLDLYQIKMDFDSVPRQIDEPLIVAAALQYFENHPSQSMTMEAYVTDSIHRLDNASTRGFAMENVTMIALLRVLDGVKSLSAARYVRHLCSCPSRKLSFLSQMQSELHRRREKDILLVANLGRHKLKINPSTSQFGFILLRL
ncbi:hypothetical protein BKA93DRAFT_746911 [Sparassis latifolia]